MDSKEKFTTYADSEPTSNHFFIEDLFNFSNEYAEEEIACADESVPHFNTRNSENSFDATVIDSFTGNSSTFSFSESPNFPGELCALDNQLAELEWVSNVGEDSFSGEELEKLQLISGLKACSNQAPQESRKNPIGVSVPGKARSKRSRAAPLDWSSRLLTVSPTTAPSKSNSVAKRTIPNTKKAELRKCFHCASDKTPQWRAGPTGPRTLCNACGMMWSKLGKLAPEYRPAASPTFVPTQHSNSHMKVEDLRRQKEMQKRSDQHNSNDDDCLIHGHSGPDYRNLI